MITSQPAFVVYLCVVQAGGRQRLTGLPPVEPHKQWRLHPGVLRRLARAGGHLGPSRSGAPVPCGQQSPCAQSLPAPIRTCPAHLR